MSRFHKFLHAVAAGYLLLGANVVFSLVAIPLAMHYLSQEEFGLWAISAQIAGFLALADLGMSSAVARLLVDCKDHRGDGRYASIIYTSWLVLFLQGILIVAAGLAMSSSIVHWFNIPLPLQTKFLHLLVFQVILQGANLPGKMFAQLVNAHQRVDLSNYAQVYGIFINLILLWTFLAAGFGIYGMIIGGVGAWGSSLIISAGASKKLNLLPRGDEKGRVSFALFQNIFRFSWDLFLMGIGSTLIAGSQTILIGHFLGLKAAAAWAICNYTFNLTCQLVWRAFDYANMSLAEMVARGENHLLLMRFRSLNVFSTSLAVLAGVLFFLCNQPFITLWTRGRIGWDALNDFLLAVSLVLRTVARCHIGLSAVTKQTEGMKYVYVLEGGAFIGICFLFGSQGSYSTFILISIFCTFLFSLSYGIWRTAKYFGLLPWQVGIQWLLPSIRAALLLVPMGFAFMFLFTEAPPGFKLVCGSVLVGLTGIVVICRLGLEESLKQEMAQRIPFSQKLFGHKKRGQADE